jgi:predicted RNase H-like HicB family nuclease
MTTKSTKRSAASRKAKGVSTRRTRPGGRAGGKAIDRPFAAATLARAAEIASQYQLVIAREENVGFLGRTVEMPYAMADGPTLEACAAATLEATTVAVATMIEQGERPPSPAREGKRDAQVNIRLTAEEKLTLEESSRAAGFRSVSDFIRAAALDRSR